MSRAAATLALIALAACSGFERASADELVPSIDRAPSAIRDACELTAHRCSHCHTLDRVVDLRPGDPGTWQATVDRMRHFPGSDIPPEEAPVLVRCLVYHSFGAESP